MLYEKSLITIFMNLSENKGIDHYYFMNLSESKGIDHYYKLQRGTFALSIFIADPVAKVAGGTRSGSTTVDIETVESLLVGGWWLQFSHALYDKIYVCHGCIPSYFSVSRFGIF